MRVERILALWIAGFIIYLVFASRITLYDIIVGIIAGFIPALVFSNILVEKPGKVLSFKRIIRAFIYILYYLFVIEPRCHFRVSAMILGLKRFKPDIVPVPYDYRTEYAVAAAANSITNTPGTVVVDIDEKSKTYYVHWLEAYTLAPEETRSSILGSFDKWIKEVFED